jgi:hypothetical protein
MTLPFDRHFEAHLPLVATAVRITSLYDAQVFMRRWVIRDKDRNLKALLRARKSEQWRADEVAMEEFTGIGGARFCQSTPGLLVHMKRLQNTTTRAVNKSAATRVLALGALARESTLPEHVLSSRATSHLHSESIAIASPTSPLTAKMSP